MFKFLRVLTLLLIFAGVALGAGRAKKRSVECKRTLPGNFMLSTRMAAR